MQVALHRSGNRLLHLIFFCCKMLKLNLIVPTTSVNISMSSACPIEFSSSTFISSPLPVPRAARLVSLASPGLVPFCAPGSDVCLGVLVPLLSLDVLSELQLAVVSVCLSWSPRILLLLLVITDSSNKEKLFHNIIILYSMYKTQ